MSVHHLRRKGEAKSRSSEDAPKLTLRQRLTVRRNKFAAWRHKWFRRLVWIEVILIHLCAAGFVSYDFFMRPNVDEFHQAAGCWAEVAMREASVLDGRARRYVMEVIYNRATELRGKASFFSKACAAAGAWHRNAVIHAPYPDFSGLASRQFYVSSNPKLWKETFEMAEWAILDYWILRHVWPWWSPKLPEKYLYYHNYPAPGSWMKGEKLEACNFRYPASGRSLAFCK